MAVPASDPAHLRQRLKPMDTSVRDYAGSILPIRHVNKIFFWQAQAHEHETHWPFWTSAAPAGAILRDPAPSATPASIAR
jgi:hypothetical protein